MFDRILVVEDTADLLANIIDVLEMEGYSVTSASNGKEALRQLSKVHPNLIITDLLMPVMNGFDLISEIRKNAKMDNIVILVYSAMPAQESEKKVLALGANAYLKKPSTLEALVETVNKLIKKD